MPDATPNLLPCPFCGSLDVGYSAQDGHDFVVCNNCGAEGPFSCKTGIAAWNQRTIPWQPIETAPKDGTWVLLAGGECEFNEESDNRKRVVTAQWTTEYRSNAGDLPIADFGRWEFAYYDSGVYGEYENPTHWQHIPSPPNTPRR
jgi:Lar family restriction alleviation protein